MLVARSRLALDLARLGLGRGGVAMVHCRMSALGRVVGGAETVVRALLEALGPEGTLVAYTGWQDGPPDNLDSLDDETRRVYLEEHPAYDPRFALSSRDHGRIPEALRTWPGARHSGHPEAGLAALGPLAEALTTSHRYDDAYGADTPYARLVELGGQVVVLGAPLDTVTLVHHAEAVARVPGKRRMGYAMPIMVGGGASGGPSQTSTPRRAPCPTSASLETRTTSGTSRVPRSWLESGGAGRSWKWASSRA